MGRDRVLGQQELRRLGHGATLPGTGPAGCSIGPRTRVAAGPATAPRDGRPCSRRPVKRHHERVSRFRAAVSSKATWGSWSKPWSVRMTPRATRDCTRPTRSSSCGARAHPGRHRVIATPTASSSRACAASRTRRPSCSRSPPRSCCSSSPRRARQRRGRHLRRRPRRAVRRLGALSPLARPAALQAAAAPHRPQHDLRLHRGELHAGRAHRRRRPGRVGAARRRVGGAVAGVVFCLGWIDAPRPARRGQLRRARLAGADRDAAARRARSTPCRSSSSWRAGSSTRRARSSTRAGGRTRGRARSASTRSSTRSSSSPPPRTTSR